MNDPLPTDALAAAPELPAATEGVTSGPPPSDAATAAPAAPAPSAASDAGGDAWDPRIHESPARRNARGRWAKLRGNAARAAQGLPLSGSTSGHAPKPKPAAEPAAPGDAPRPDPASDLRWEDPAASAPIHDGVPVPETPHRPLEAYRSTARGVVVGMFGTCRMIFGPAWTPDAEEKRAHQEAMQEWLYEMQVRPFGAGIAVVILWIDSIAKRADDAMTKARASAMWRWMASRSARQPQPIAAQPEQAPPPPAPRRTADEIDRDAKMKAYTF